MTQEMTHPKYTVLTVSHASKPAMVIVTAVRRFVVPFSISEFGVRNIVDLGTAGSFRARTIAARYCNINIQ